MIFTQDAQGSPPIDTAFIPEASRFSAQAFSMRDNI
jgi:hypothetical protein